MEIFPAIDIIGGEAVRLVKGNYDQKTVYNSKPEETARSFKEAGAKFIHVVDLDGAKSGNTPNIETIKKIVNVSGLKVEVGGGIRSKEVVQKYLEAGVFRVILGTIAVEHPEFVKEMVEKYGEHIAVGVDIKDGKVAIKGWTELSSETCVDFCKKMEKIGVRTIICTDISKDGLLSGTNMELYNQLSNELAVQIVASGGVTTLDDVRQLKAMNLYGVIMGKALYTGNIDLKEALALVEEDVL